MKKQYTFILQVLLICLIAAKGSFATNDATIIAPKLVTTVALDIECPDSFTESATPSCEFILPDYTSLANDEVTTTNPELIGKSLTIIAKV